MKKLGISVKSKEEYNYQCKTEYTSPTKEMLFEPISIAAHMVYLCEGWHTNNTTYLDFVNQDTQLIDIFLYCVKNTYLYSSMPRIAVVYDFKCEESSVKALEYVKIYENEPIKLLKFNDKQRENPILRIRAGGKRMSKEFIDNSYLITRELTKSLTSH
jgi:hypothetical protein